MSWATCYSGSNNIHFNNPPLMSDGRHLTNWDPGCTANNTLRSRVGIKSNYDYRQYLMKNADKIMGVNNELANQDNSRHNIIKSQESKNTVKYLYKSLEDNTAPYGYEKSDLKNMYLNRQQLNHKLKAPIMTQEHMLLFRSMQ